MFADCGQPSQVAQSFVEIPNPRVTTTTGRIEVTDVRLETVTGRLLDPRDNPVLDECGRPVYACVLKSEILCPAEQSNMMSWWELGEQAIAPYVAPRKYSLESLINRLDGLNLDELYALVRFV